MNEDDIRIIRDRIFALKDFRFHGDIRCIDFDGVYVSYDGVCATLGFNSKTTLARGLFLLAKGVTEGKIGLTIRQKPQYPSCGVMLDMSRGGVMRPEKVREYIAHMAALGLNLLMLYTEDTYEIPGYPFFGYHRGRYTRQELRAIDDYADEMGVELVPCIQTLGHLGQYTQWGESAPITDVDGILLIDEPKTYEFIEAAIRSVRQTFRSQRIHIGMDEAHDVGLGKYLDKHGYQNRFELLNRHLRKVVGICNQYGFKPMMWSDMYFRIGSPTRDYYNAGCVVPRTILDDMPDVSLVYWDYYHTREEEYEGMFRNHEQFDKEVVFAGGIWTWGSLLPNAAHTFDTMMPALKSCAAHRIGTVFATLWSDDGCETNHFMALPLLPLFSEYCYAGSDCGEDRIWDMGAFAGGIPREAIMVMSDFHIMDNGRSAGKAIFYSDILYRLIDFTCDLEELRLKFENGYRVMRRYAEKNDRNAHWYRFAQLLFAITARKADMLGNLQRKYREKDLAYLKNLAENELPALKTDYEKAFRLHKQAWMSTYKANGFETINFRYGGVIARIEYTAEVLGEYVNGAIPQIDELEEEHLSGGSRRNGYSASRLITPSAAF